MDPKTQKRILYAVGWTVALVGGALIEQHMVTGNLEKVVVFAVWLAGVAKGKAMDAPGASKE